MVEPNSIGDKALSIQYEFKLELDRQMTISEFQSAGVFGPIGREKSAASVRESLVPPRADAAGARPARPQFCGVPSVVAESTATTRRTPLHCRPWGGRSLTTGASTTAPERLEA